MSEHLLHTPASVKIRNFVINRLCGRMSWESLRVVWGGNVFTRRVHGYLKDILDISKGISRGTSYIRLSYLWSARSLTKSVTVQFWQVIAHGDCHKQHVQENQHGQHLRSSRLHLASL